MDILNELEEFRKFKDTYNFKQKDITIIDDLEYCDGFPLVVDGEMVGKCEKWINVGYKSKDSLSRVLSNLFPYEFEFRGKKFGSIEAFFQGIKFVDSKMQDYVFKYSGMDSNKIKACTDYNWKESGIIYWQGKEVDRYSKEYDDLVDELYISAIQNPLYRSALKNCDLHIIHSIGDTKKCDTVFTRYEFEKELNCLKDFLKSRN